MALRMAAVLVAAAVAAGCGKNESGPERPPTLGIDTAGIYSAQCAVCHGERGRGDGPVAKGMSPRPADFTAAAFKEKCANIGAVERAIRDGVPGTAMPAWGRFSNAEVEALARRICKF